MKSCRATLVGPRWPGYADNEVAGFTAASEKLTASFRNAKYVCQ
ncbi:hypothetical protein [Siphonobacter sp. SORGH_AS_1065]|nr:hypothetical protein [Siphonobacter sp. SORGH_AS_1065]MDQ1090001.1 hypothetical protein [Siphonobacter sp. SORGH_AS_1065]